MKKYLHGLLLVGAIAVLSTLLEDWLEAYVKLEKLTIGIVLGILFTALRGLNEVFRPGVQFALKRLLKWGIVLLGFKLNFLAVAELGPKLVVVVLCMIPLVLYGSQLLGKRMGMGKKLSTLIGVGSSICGASAIVALSQVIDADDDDSVLAVSVISFLGAIGVLMYSSLALVLDMSDAAFGVWSGLSLQGVAHAIAAAFARGAYAGEVGTLVKMTRVLMLAPVSLVLALQFGSGQQKNRVGVPGYVLLFVVAGVISTMGMVPAPAVNVLAKTSSYLILAAMIAMGLVVDLKQMREKGVKAIFHGAAVFGFIATVTYGIANWLVKN